MRATVLLAALWAAAPARPPMTVMLRDRPARPESRVWITGSSNIRRFTCRASGLSGRVALRADPEHKPMVAGRNVAESPSLAVPVAKLDCGIGIMNRHLRETIRAVDYPTVTFRLDRYAAEIVTASPTVRILGRLSVAGVERPLAVDAVLAADTLGIMHVRGAYVVRMTDFGVQPPRRFGGLLKVHDRVTVHFDVVPQEDDDSVDVADAATRSISPD